MMILTAYGKQYRCEKAVKGSDTIRAFLDGDVILDHMGITDFGGYDLVDENGNPAEFSIPALDEITKLQLAIVELYERGISRDS